jgi:hypothetical protein
MHWLPSFWIHTNHLSTADFTHHLWHTIFIHFFVATVNYLSQCNSTTPTQPPSNFQENTYREHVGTISRWLLILHIMNQGKILNSYLVKYGTPFCIHTLCVYTCERYRMRKRVTITITTTTKAVVFMTYFNTELHNVWNASNKIYSVFPSINPAHCTHYLYTCYYAFFFIWWTNNLVKHITTWNRFLNCHHLAM